MNRLPGFNFAAGETGRGEISGRVGAVEGKKRSFFSFYTAAEPVHRLFCCDTCRRLATLASALTDKQRKLPTGKHIQSIERRGGGQIRITLLISKCSSLLYRYSLRSCKGGHMAENTKLAFFFFFFFCY